MLLEIRTPLFFSRSSDVGRRPVDHVDGAGDQRGAAAGILRRADQDEAVDLGDALGIPVGLVLHQLGALARHEAGELERAGARRLHGELVPVLAELLPLRRARDQEPQELIREERIDRLGLDLDLHVTGLPVAQQAGQARPHLRRLAGVELRRVLVEDLLEVPDHGIGVERRAVVELHARAQLEGPQRLVGLAHLPLGRQARDHLARPVGRRRAPRRSADRRSCGRYTGRRWRHGRAARW